MEWFRRSVEIGSNIAIILLAVLLGYFVISRSISSQQGGANLPDSMRAGTKLQAAQIDWGRSEKNLLMVLSTTCKYCTESFPFYRRIAEQNAGNRQLNLIATFPQEVAEGEQYLRERGFAVDQIVKADPAEFSVRGTPTLILTDANGIVLESWVGKLPADKENEVVERIFSKLVVEMR